MENPNIFAGAILSSGATYAPQSALESIVGIPIRNFVGTQDEDGLAEATTTTMARYVCFNPLKNYRFEVYSLTCHLAPCRRLPSVLFNQMDPPSQRADLKLCLSPVPIILQ
jgi:hypothetical protein